MLCSLVCTEDEDKLEQFQKLANSHLGNYQQSQKGSYDKVTCERFFQDVQKVLLLLPTSESGLLAKWQGPYSHLRTVRARLLQEVLRISC